MMIPMAEELARAQMRARLSEVEGLWRGGHPRLARRRGRKAEEAERQARLAVDRLL